MIKNRFYLVLVIVFIFGIIMVSSASDYKSKVSSDVYKSLEKNDKARVIIKLREPSLEKGFIIKSVKTDYDIEHEKRKIKEEIINKFKKENVERIFDSEIAVTASSEEINSLNLDSNVESIYIDKPIKAFLQDSVPLVNATRTWPITFSGLNITGVAETICIIDTGINFSHPDLVGKNRTGCLIDCISPVSGCVENCSVFDDHGHGTHVAGIVAANGSARGVAIGAGLIGVKVLNAAGSGSGSDMDAGIDWCISNADTYNISVISMSLGTDCDDTPQYCYSSYCDSVGVEQSTALKVDNATAHNISVIIAAGNDANYTAVSSPGCIKNATTVSATDKSDNIATAYSNRNNMTDLVAPGSLINSTKSTAGYETRSGTSMATPTVAGAFVLVREYFKLQNGRVPTPIDIQNALNLTGKRISDAQSNLNYSRINIYAAILSLDSVAPNVTLISPGNNTINSTINQTFSCNATDLQLANITFYLWNSTNGIVYNETKNISGTSNSSVFNVTNLSYDSHKWNCLAYDVNNNYSFAISNFSLTIRYLTANLTSPSNGFITNQNQTYNCSFTTENSHALKNSTLYIWNSSGNLIYNFSQNISGLTNSTLFYYNFTSDGNYSWNCLVFNNNSDNASADSNYSVRYDITLPNISSLSYTQSSSYFEEDDLVRINVNITWNTNENANSTVVYGINSSNLNNTSTNSSFNLSHIILLLNLSESIVYYYNITSCDSAGNCVRNGTNNFTTINLPVGFGGGGPAPSVTTTTASINWSTNKKSNYSMIYGINISNLNNNLSNSSLVTAHSILLSGLISSTLYYYNITSCDSAGNCVRNGTNNFTTSAEAVVITTGSSSSGGGSSGGGSTSKTYTAKAEETSVGYNQELAKNDKIIFSVPSETGVSHSLIINEVKDNYVNITIKSDIINFKLLVGESRKLNLSSSLFYNLYIKLESIINNKANVTIKTIHEDILTGGVKNETSIEKPADVSATDNSKDEGNYSIKSMIIIVISVILFLFIIIVILIILISIKKSKIINKEKSIKEYKDVFDSHIKPKGKINKKIDRK